MILGRLLVTIGLLFPAGCGYAKARALDLADCFKLSVGAGLGLAADAHFTDFISPGIGIATYTWNAGYVDRDVNGVWIESDVVNTPRVAYELFSDEFEQTPSDQLDEQMFVARLALSSLNLPNERWIRKSGEVTVEYFSLFNFGELGSYQRAKFLTGHLLYQGETPTVPEKSVWKRGFIEIGATAVCLHARTGWNPLETIDFVAGLFGFDPAGDD